MRGFILWTLWNLFLAAIPVALGYAAAAVGRQARARRSAVMWCGFGVLGFLWLAFLPNTCYLITEWRHLLEFVDERDLYQQAERNPRLLFFISVLALFYVCYSGFGVLTLTLAIRPIERLLRQWRFSFPCLAPMLFLLLSLGVYLGLIVRLNSWDLWQRPAKVWASVAAIPQSSLLISAIIVFALLLWGLYEGLDLWVDGVKERIRRWVMRNA